MKMKEEWWNSAEYPSPSRTGSRCKGPQQGKVWDFQGIQRWSEGVGGGYGTERKTVKRPVVNVIIGNL